MSHGQFTLLAALLVGLAWFFLLRGRNRPAPLTPRQIQELRRRGAVVLDVRTPAEFAQGHAKGAGNIPLGNLKARLEELDRSVPILTCCASGARSEPARTLLLRRGLSGSA